MFNSDLLGAYVSTLGRSQDLLQLSFHFPVYAHQLTTNPTLKRYEVQAPPIFLSLPKLNSVHIFYPPTPISGHIPSHLRGLQNEQDSTETRKKGVAELICSFI